MVQKKWVKHSLKKYGRVTRNMALKKHITRLSAIINTLKKEGYIFEARYIKNKKDYEYMLIKSNTLKTKVQH